MFCTKCGKELKEGAKFCTYCGTPCKKKLDAGQQPSVKLCTKCGKELKEGLKFCTYCGTPVNPISNTVQQTPVREKEAVEQETQINQTADVKRETPIGQNSAAEQETSVRQSAPVAQEVPARETPVVEQKESTGDSSEEKTEILFEKNVYMDSAYSAEQSSGANREDIQPNYSNLDTDDASLKKPWKIALIAIIGIAVVVAILVCWLFLFGGEETITKLMLKGGTADVLSTETESTEDVDETESELTDDGSTEATAVSENVEVADQSDVEENTGDVAADAPFAEVPERSRQWQQADSSSIMVYPGTVEDYSNALNPASYGLNDAHMQKQGIYFDYYFPPTLYYTITYEYHNDPWAEADQGFGLSPFLTSHAQEVYGGNSTDSNLHLAKKAEIGYYGSKGSTLDCTLWEFDEKSATSSPMNYLSEVSAMYSSAFDHVDVLRAPGADGCLYIEGMKNGFTHRIILSINPQSKPKSVMRMWICYPTDGASDEEKLEMDYVAECLYRMCGFSPAADSWDATNFETFDEYKASR